jgi:hypothetical protein
MLSSYRAGLIYGLGVVAVTNKGWQKGYENQRLNPKLKEPEPEMQLGLGPEHTRVKHKVI